MPKAKAENSLPIPPAEVKAFVQDTAWGYIQNFHLLTGKSHVKKPICHENKRVLACDTQHNFKWMSVLQKAKLRRTCSKEPRD